MTTKGPTINKRQAKIIALQTVCDMLYKEIGNSTEIVTSERPDLPPSEVSKIYDELQVIHDSLIKRVNRLRAERDGKA